MNPTPAPRVASRLPLRPTPAHPRALRLAALLASVLAILAPVHPGLAQPSASAAAAPAVEGLTDRTVATDRATFRVPSVRGSVEAATLDGVPIGFDVPHTVTDPDYHELLVSRAPAPGAPAGTHRVRFIVRASERGNSEWGLPPWTPPAPVPASLAELAAARLRVLLPPRFPSGLPIPVVAWLDGPDGHALRAHALLTSTRHDPVLLRRGVGSGWIPAVPSGGTHAYTATIPGHSIHRDLVIEDDVAWAIAGGTLAADTTWPADARISLDRTLTIPAGLTLQVGAGTVVRVAAGVDLIVQGSLILRGTPERPVTFLPAGNQPWGGFRVEGTAAGFDAEGTIFTGSGADPAWFDTHPGYDVHRPEQALLLVDGGRASLRDCAAIDGHGQFGHGRDADIELRRTLVQRFITGGEYSGGSVRIRDSALIEFPNDDAVFADSDNDALYLTSGRHEITDTLIGWAKDDGIDAGSGGAGSVLVSNVWAEAIYHEAFAWSGAGRSATNLHCVALHCGQGIECGWSTGADSPRVHASDCLVLGNLSGVRFGDNYDWTYNGFLRVTHSLLLHNHRDIFDLNWDDWSPRPAQMDLQANQVSTPHSRYPGNTTWMPEAGGPRLLAFLNTPPEAPPGIGFATHSLQAPFPGPAHGIPVGLSRFHHRPVHIDYVLEGSGTTLASGRLSFSPGETLRRIPIPAEPGTHRVPLHVRLHSPEGAEVSGADGYHLLPTAGSTPTVLIPTGARWRYLDTGIDPGDAWPFPGYDDGGWREGPAKLGFGDGDETTVIDGGPSSNRHATTWFRHRLEVPDPGRHSELEIRLRRDDGALVHLNGLEAFRSNLPPGPVTAATYTGQSTSSESTFFTTRVPASMLRPGGNLVAVEVHQSDRTSSDLGFDLELLALPAVRLAFHRDATTTLLLWHAPGFQLESAPTPHGPWIAPRNALSPFPIPADPASASFHRLRRTTP